MKVKRFLLFISLFVVIFMSLHVVFAQGDTTPVIPPDVLSPEQTLQSVISLFMATIAAFAGSALTTTIVSGLKLFVPDTIDAGLLKNIVGLILTVVYWVAVRYNATELFTTVGQFVLTFVPAIITLIGTLAGSSMLHRLAVEHNIPVLSYKRSV